MSTGSKCGKICVEAIGMDWKWVREPGNYLIEPYRIEITAMPHTDLWQRRNWRPCRVNWW